MYNLYEFVMPIKHTKQKRKKKMLTDKRDRKKRKVKKTGHVTHPGQTVAACFPSPPYFHSPCRFPLCSTL